MNDVSASKESFAFKGQSGTYIFHFLKFRFASNSLVIC